VSLSTAGEYFLVLCARLLGTLKEADDAMARFKRLEHGLLTIGMVSTAKYFVPQLLARFRESIRAWRCACAWPATASSWWR
jgi:DNA-binding transcriptional LysR family regulator